MCVARAFRSCFFWRYLLPLAPKRSSPLNAPRNVFYSFIILIVNVLHCTVCVRTKTIQHGHVKNVKLRANTYERETSPPPLLIRKLEAVFRFFFLFCFSNLFHFDRVSTVFVCPTWSCLHETNNDFPVTHTAYDRRAVVHCVLCRSFAGELHSFCTYANDYGRPRE